MADLSLSPRVRVTSSSLPSLDGVAPDGSSGHKRPANRCLGMDMKHGLTVDDKSVRVGVMKCMYATPGVYECRFVWAGTLIKRLPLTPIRVYAC